MHGRRDQIKIALTALCAIFLVVSLITGNPVFAYISIACGGYFALANAIDSLRNREVDVTVLMVFAAIGAIVVGHPEDAAGLLFLFALSGTLEHLAMARTQSAIEGLIKLRPEKAVRLLPEGTETVPVSDLRRGDHIRIASFETLPTDGTVLTGETDINEAAMTGESVPVAKRVGDSVLAGTQNLSGMITVEVTAPTGESTLDKIVKLVEDAQENRGSGERISRWFGQRYTFFVLAVFVIAFVVRYAMGAGASSAFYSSLILLVALSPCALVISTPATTLSALAYAARRGILVRGGEFLESMGQVTVACLDKTGTLTEGKFALAEICVCQAVGPNVERQGEACWHPGGPLSEEAAKMLRAAAAAEQYSSHPLAEAIVRSARELGVDIPEALSQSDTPGLGVVAQLAEGPVKIGQPKFFDNLPADFLEHVKELQHEGMTAAIMEFDGRFAALGLQDRPKAGAREALDALRAQGVKRIIMLTGDNPKTAEAVARTVGTDSFQAALMPADKTRIITELEESGEKVLMVGDGINDAPSLTRATVGVAMGGLGSDIALNAADVVLMQDRLERLPELIRLGRKTNRVIMANLIFASGVILTLTISSFFVQLPLALAVLGHEGSTVLVILNGLRLLAGPGRA